jgi:hypothetical protein
MLSLELRGLKLVAVPLGRLDPRHQCLLLGLAEPDVGGRVFEGIRVG